MNKLAWPFFIFFSITIGLYPVTYYLFDLSMGLLATKPAEVLSDSIWKVAFYVHISFGGIALLTGWSQFSKRIRNRYLQLHRTLGKIYLISVLAGGSAGFYIALFATGGIVSVLGFAGLALVWLFTSGTAYLHIRKLHIDDHQQWMIRSYALTFAAVTLRIWLPLLDFGLAMDFVPAYRIIAWLCWVPNIIVAELVVRNLRKPKPVLA